MGDWGPEAAVVRAVRHGRWLACLTLATLLSLWTLGALHAAEHTALGDTAPCSTCIAVAFDGLAADTAQPFGPLPDANVHVPPSHEEPASTCPVLRRSARAPPTRRA